MDRSLNYQSSQTRPDAAPPVINPPPICPPPPPVARIAPAPPPVAPPAQPPLSLEGNEPRPTVFHRAIRDLKLGGACLIIGLLVGQIQWRVRDTESFARSQPAGPTLEKPEPSATADTADSLLDDLPVASVETETVDFTQQLTPLPALPSADVIEPAIMESTVTTGSATDMAVVDLETPSREPALPADWIQAITDVKLVSISMPSPADANASNSIVGSQPIATGRTDTCPTTETATLNTALSWTKSPAEACQLAQAQDKLVFLIHVSGNFEIPGFT